MTAVRPNRVLVVLDDASAPDALLDLSCTLARLTQRELQLVYVESVAALAAAALPAAQVLAVGTARWAPLAALDVERAWKAQASRLRLRAEKVSLQHAVVWSLQITRGNLHEATRSLSTQSDLLLVGGSAAALALATRPARRQVVVALDDGSPAGRQAVAIARRLCEALGARLLVHALDATPDGASVPANADLVVMPAPRLPPHALVSPPRTPTLLVSLAAAPEP